MGNTSWGMLTYYSIFPIVMQDDSSKISKCLQIVQIDRERIRFFEGFCIQLCVNSNFNHRHYGIMVGNIHTVHGNVLHPTGRLKAAVCENVIDPNSVVFHVDETKSTAGIEYTLVGNVLTVSEE
jgi:hypothetical protein